MTALMWTITSLLFFGAFSIFVILLYEFRRIPHYNFLSALLASIMFFMSLFAILHLNGVFLYEAAEFIAIYLLLVLAILQYREVVLKHSFR